MSKKILSQLHLKHSNSLPSESSNHLLHFESLQQKLLQESDKLSKLINFNRSVSSSEGKPQLEKFDPNKIEYHHPVEPQTIDYCLSPMSQQNYNFDHSQENFLNVNPNQSFISVKDEHKRIRPKDNRQVQRKLTYNLVRGDADHIDKSHQRAQLALMQYKSQRMQKQPYKLTVSTISSNKTSNLIKTFEEIKRKSGQSQNSQKSSKSLKISINEFQILKFLEEGQFGSVYLAKHKPSNFICALKKIPKNIFMGDERFIKQITREIKIQSYLDHPNIVQMYSFFSDQECLYLILELCVSGNVYNSLKVSGRFSEEKVRVILKQVCHAIEFMHDNDIIHRDIKPENILLHEGIAKVCDFGWSINSPLLRDTRCGTPLYSSPEIVQKCQYDNKIDVWNIGILTYELIFGRVPFQIRSEEDLIKIVDEQIYFPKSMPVSLEGKDFILKCLEKNPKERMSMAKLIDHQFLNGSL